ncbi:MAG: hypothetical protein M3R15_31590 [Acidobacteriota bacterium]|nr:hypothetical protein [Acidobacteriota bacterium]
MHTSSRSDAVNLAVRFNARKAEESNRRPGQRRLNLVVGVSIVADATAGIFIIHRALKRTAKFKPPLTR